MSIYPSEKPYIFYHITYSGDKMPPNYFGSTSISQVEKGYMGSIKSKKYKQIWQKELLDHPELFNLQIISYHHTRQEALDKELKIQKIFNVVDNPLFVNMSYATVNGYFGRSLSGRDSPSYGIKRGTNKQHSIKMKKLWSDPSSSFNDETRKINFSNKMKEKWKDKNSGLNSLVRSEKMKDKMKKLWSDPSSSFNSKEYKEKRQYFKSEDFSNKMSLIRRTEEMKSLQSKITKTMWEDPNHKINSQETKEKRKQSIIKSHNTEEYRKKIFDSNAKNYIVIDPLGNNIKIKGLVKFCNENNLSHSAMIKVYQGKQKSHKGWKCIKL